MKTGLVGPSYEQRSLPFDAQRAINLFPVLDEMGKEVASLYGTPGLSTFADTGAGPVRGGFKSGNGRVFFVSGANLKEVFSDGTETVRGALSTSSGRVSICEGINHLAICDGTKLYYLTYETNFFSQVTDPDFPSSVGFVTNVDGYFKVSVNETGRFCISTQNDVTQWDALDFATAESNPDALRAIINAVGQSWLFGERTTEIWTNTGSSAFPFGRIAGAIMEAGILAKHSALEVDNTVIWLGQDEFGGGIVYRANGFTPQRISTTPIEKRIQEASSPEDIYAWAYQEEGHVFYILSGGGLETSLCFDLSTQLWHERAFLNANGAFEQHLGSCHVYAFGKHLVGSRVDGKIYEMDLDYYTDDGEEKAWERVYTHISNEDRRVRYNRLDVGIETGVGLQGEDEPWISLYVSKDGGRTYSDPINRGIGKAGEYQTKVSFRRLGIAEQLTLKLRGSAPVKTTLTGSYLS